MLIAYTAKISKPMPMWQTLECNTASIAIIKTAFKSIQTLSSRYLVRAKPAAG